MNDSRSMRSCIKGLVPSLWASSIRVFGLVGSLGVVDVDCNVAFLQSKYDIPSASNVFSIASIREIKGCRTFVDNHF